MDELMLKKLSNGRDLTDTPTTPNQADKCLEKSYNIPKFNLSYDDLC